MKPLKEEPSLLICDGHYFYISNLNNVVLAREKMWSLCVCFPLDTKIPSLQLFTYWPPENILEVGSRVFLGVKDAFSFRHSRMSEMYGRTY